MWIGILVSHTPTLSWSVDNIPLDNARLRALRPLASAIPGELLDERAAENFTGVFEIIGLEPGRVYKIGVTASADGTATSAELRTKTLPTVVPGLLDGTFNILLVSCFY